MIRGVFRGHLDTIRLQFPDVESHQSMGRTTPSQSGTSRRWGSAYTDKVKPSTHGFQRTHADEAVVAAVELEEYVYSGKLKPLTYGPRRREGVIRAVHGTAVEPSTYLEADGTADAVS